MNSGPELDGHALHLFRWLQYASSIIGLVAVVVALLVWIYHAPASEGQREHRAGCGRSRTQNLDQHSTPLASPLAGIAAGAWRAHAHMSALAAGIKVTAVAVSAMRASAISLVFGSLLLLLRLRIGDQAAQT